MNGYGLNHALIRVTGGLWAAVPIVKSIRKERRRKRVLKQIEELKALQQYALEDAHRTNAIYWQQNRTTPPVNLLDTNTKGL